MNMTDSVKVLKGGFTVIRASDHELVIKKLKGAHRWEHMEKGFASKAALHRRVKELVKDPMVVED